MSLKRCRRCGIDKPLEDFYAHKNTKDGRDSDCKNCTKAKSRLSILKRKSTLEYKQMRIRLQNKYARNNPLKVRAHALARRNRNKLIKAACERCGVKSGLHMHHPDYNKPLEVTTLCAICHAKEHNE